MFHADRFQSVIARSLLTAVVFSALAGCGNSVQEVYIDGQIYDGATGDRLTGYKMTLEYRDKTVEAQVSDTGRFLMHLPVFQDYTVTITANGYRTFRSHNPGFNIPNPDSSLSTAHGSQTFYFDAYLFPSNLVAPKVTLNVRKETSTGDFAKGKVRLRPVSLSSIADSLEELPSGVPGQLWTNDEDLQAKPLIKTLEGGALEIPGSELVYGVRYLINIYEVEGFQPLEDNLVAGVDQSRTLLMEPENGEPLVLVSSTIASCEGPTSPTDQQAGLITFTFNQDIALADKTPGASAEAVDSAFSIVSYDDDVDSQRNVLWPDASSNEQEHGTVLQVSGKTLTLFWNASRGLQTKDTVSPYDAISMTWNLSGVEIRPANRNQATHLVALAPESALVTCR